MTESNSLPPGQYEYPSFDRFGLGLFADKFPRDIKPIEISLKGDVAQECSLTTEIQALARFDQTNDFHCVTTWSVRNQHWSGFRFADFYHQLVVPLAKPNKKVTFVVFRGQDSYACSMQLEDLLVNEVLLADTLNGEKLDIAHGAPLRLVAPAHYGYKNVKHIHSIEFWQDSSHFRFPLPYPDLMNHPRGRVALEERARILPNWIIRPLYKFLMPFARKKHKRKLDAFIRKNGS